MTPTSKTQIDKLGDRLRKGDIREDDLRQLDAYRRSFAGPYEEVAATIRNATGLDPTGRPAKSTSSVGEKLRRDTTMRLTQMQDIAGCRLVVQDVLAQNQVVEHLTAALPRASMIDRRKWPSGDYRAVHIIATAQNKPIEIQVRTELQHLWAQLSEKLADVFGPAIKYGVGDPDNQVWLSQISLIIARCEDLELDPQNENWLAEVKQQLRRYLADQIVRWESIPQGDK